jgi:hypothetical protein
MPLRAIVYASDASAGFDQAKVENLIVDAERFNRLAGVTGVLLFDGQRFLQYIEGPVDGLEAVFARISSSRSHTGVMELARGTIGKRLFPYWAMHAVPVETMDTSRLVAASWAEIDDEKATAAGPSSGVVDLQALVRHHLEVTSKPLSN